MCLPPAGSGCRFFRSWQSAAGTGVSVVGVQLPGRENRWRDPAPADVDDAVAAVVGELVGLGALEQPVVIFGQSFGGLLGYEVARRLGDGHGAWPAALVVAACRPPHLWIGAGRGLVDDDQALEQLLQERALDEYELDEGSRQLMLDMLRRDARLSLTYRDPCGATVSCPVWAWGGRDDGTVTAEHLAGWDRYAGASFHHRQFDGGHYFPGQHTDLVVALLRDMLPNLMRGSASDDR
ncbi:thioesterase II family protein [Lentzea indica]|uniref:thioesterase II family protein n=1 Tax=Lentzea indica TaxID=2604800 RepID=UPI00143A137F|nr:thioesterase [Lentzea indica]